MSIKVHQITIHIRIASTISVQMGSDFYSPMLLYSHGKRSQKLNCSSYHFAIFLATGLVLEIIPSSLRVVLADASDIKRFSYFDIRPISYEIITPFLSSLATIACIVLFVIRTFKPYKMRGVGVWLSLVAALLSIAHLLYLGSEAINAQSILIASCLFSVLIINSLDFCLGK